MKRIILLIILINTQFLSGQTVVLDSNGVTIKWTGTSVPNPYFVQANPRGTGMEWFAIVNNSTKSNVSNYARNLQSGRNYFTPTGHSTPIPFNNIVTTLVTSMNDLLYLTPSFNQFIESWDVSNVTNMNSMFSHASVFNQPIDSWDVSNVTNMYGMFTYASAFNQPIGSWDVGNVNDMTHMFSYASAFNQPIDSWDVSNVINMPVMFYEASSFNQPIGSWDVGNVIFMANMFNNASAFNQPIDTWNVNNVTNMKGMFWEATSFNQPIGSWNVSNVSDMSDMFGLASAFNQPIGSWNVGNVTTMFRMFQDATSFNKDIGSWDVRNVTRMESMFKGATTFNQNIDSWNVSNVTNMSTMFDNSGLSTANYDALLIGWSTISPNETPLVSNVTFSAGGTNYCNGATARSSIISTYGWTITDGGLDCSTLSTDEFDTSIINLFPNPVSNELNVKTDYKLNNQPYTIIDSLGRIVLNGKLNNIDTIINVEQLTKGFYYLKIAGNSANNKFIKE